ncbi:MAG TPA: hypothetical protein VM070_06590, partial [Candidatus Saccharimonadales bacterium]|nr:hypothetical protein [Candidatus Saccharimonadales bacterium]
SLVVLLGAALGAALPAIAPADPPGSPPRGLLISLALAAAALALGALAAAGAARLTRRDPASAAIGGGTRDGGVAVAMVLAGGAGATSVPLAYAGLLALVALACAVGRRRRQTPDRSPGALT